MASPFQALRMTFCHFVFKRTLSTFQKILQYTKGSPQGSFNNKPTYFKQDSMATFLEGYSVFVEFLILLLLHTSPATLPRHVPSPRDGAGGI